MSVVTGGLGLPEEGALVAQGLGLSELDPNAMTAHLAGSGSLTATLTATGEEPPPVTGGGGRGAYVYNPPRTKRPRRKVVDISANLHGWSSVEADIEFTYTPPPVDPTPTRRRRERELVLTGMI